MPVTPIPAQVDHITVEWLNDVLDDEFGTIESFTLVHFGEGVGILGELARLTLSYTSGQRGPATLVAKCASSSEENQFLATMMGFYLREVNFYRGVSSNLNVRVPAPYHVDASETGVPFVLLIEDIAGATTPNQIDGLSVEEAEKIISTIAPLHAQYWGRDAELDALAWLPPMNNELYKGGGAMATALFPAFAEHFAGKITDDFMAVIGAACERYVDLLDYAVTVGTSTLTHTDCRAENYLFGGPDGDDAVTVIDFQLSTRHIGMWDVANLLSGSMTTELRRSNEDRLINHYVGLISAAGIDFTYDQALLEYRVCLLHQCPAQVITSDLQGGNDRGAELLEQLHLRPVIAAADHNVGELLTNF